MEPVKTASSDVAAWRRRASRAITVGACLLVAFALLAPNDADRITLWSFARIPVEALVVVSVVLLMGARGRRALATVVGVALGLVVLVKTVDMGFYVVFDRPFHPAFDWASFGPAVDLLASAVGRAGAILLVLLAGALAVVVVAAVAAAVVRLSRLVVEHRPTAAKTSVAVGLVWIVCAVSGVQIASGEPVAAREAVAFGYDRVRQVRDDFRDHRQFVDELAVDAFRQRRGDELLTALRGKDVVVAFVESYGRVAVEHPEIAPQVEAVLTAGTHRLRAAGFGSRSAFLTSPTSGGASWLAHSTLQSGLRIDSQARYDTLVVGDRLTLSGAFGRAGWRTVGVVPANTEDWPEGNFYGFDAYYDARNAGYGGPSSEFATMPDQYTLAAFHRRELAVDISAGDPAPVMAEIDLVSSHWPWDPVPRPVAWADVGDGSVFAGRPAPEPAPGGVHAAYADSIEYSLRTLISYAQTHGDDDLVLIFLGDHQPASMITGGQAGREVPITIVARDTKVIDRISGWRWQDGLRPGPAAPVWPMEAFRDRFLAAFS